MSMIKRNLAWLLMSQGATWLMAVLLLLVAPRQLGDKAFGQLAFAVIYVSFFALVALFGTDIYLMKSTARDTASVGRYVFNTLVMKAIATSILIVLAIGLAALLRFDGTTFTLVCIGCISLFCDTLTNTIVGGLKGLQYMRGPAIWDVTRSYVGGLLGIILLFSGYGIVAYALVLNLASVIPLVANGVRIWPIMRPGRQLDFAVWKTVIVGGFPFFMWSAILAFYATIDIPVLEGLAGSETVGWYALAYRWVSMPAFFAASVATAFFPALSAEGVQISAAFTRMANGALRLVAFVATPAAVGIALIAHSFVARLYGAEFMPAVPLMRLLSLHIPIVGLDIVLGSVLIAMDKQRQWVMVGVAAAIFNPLVNLVAIPMSEQAFGNGAIGAAVVTIFTEVIMLVGAILLRPAGVLDRATAGVIGRIAVASISMVPVLLLLDTSPLALRVGAGVATYAVASLLLKTISWREIRSQGRGWVSTDPVPTHAMPPVTADF